MCAVTLNLSSMVLSHALVTPDHQMLRRISKRVSDLCNGQRLSRLIIL